MLETRSSSQGILSTPFPSPLSILCVCRGSYYPVLTIPLTEQSLRLLLRAAGGRTPVPGSRAIPRSSGVSQLQGGGDYCALSRALTGIFIASALFLPVHGYQKCTVPRNALSPEVHYS